MTVEQDAVIAPLLRRQERAVGAAPLSGKANSNGQDHALACGRVPALRASDFL